MLFVCYIMLFLIPVIHSFVYFSYIFSPISLFLFIYLSVFNICIYVLCFIYLFILFYFTVI